MLKIEKSDSIKELYAMLYMVVFNERVLLLTSENPVSQLNIEI